MSTFRSLFEDNREALELEWIGGTAAADDPLETPATTGLASADLIGHLNLIHPNRIHVLGIPEIDYFARMEPARRVHYSTELFAGKPLAIVIADGLTPPPELIALTAHSHLPSFSSPKSAAEVIEVLRIYLARMLAASCTMHGVYMDVLGMGVLLAGESGVGKSELGLELISRGHGLVADDVVDFSRIAPDTVEGRCPPLLSNLLEVRGLGLLDIKAIFGETAVRRKMKLRLIVELRRRTATEIVDRLPLEGQTYDVLGLAIRKVILPVADGRNLAVLTEAAVRNTILQLRGIDTMREFMDRQRHSMSDDAY